MAACIFSPPTYQDSTIHLTITEFVLDEKLQRTKCRFFFKERKHKYLGSIFSFSLWSTALDLCMPWLNVDIHGKTKIQINSAKWENGTFWRISLKLNHWTLNLKLWEVTLLYSTMSQLLFYYKVVCIIKHFSVIWSPFLKICREFHFVFYVWKLNSNIVHTIYL